MDSSQFKSITLTQILIKLPYKKANHEEPILFQVHSTLIPVFRLPTVPCPTIDAKATACVAFATGKDTKPSAVCCSGLQQLAQTVKSVDDKKAV
ncbi:hypothetical protein J1N35_033284 [Gossypium stocksii]|uniref:Uncharacterized protein n=1 Tax=Gossypium stocksii TaxID=47602 RepID=A0A9D3URR0_9ROSI|nr:hypothetical protein J1N35_033284 [Gossypium stocksii]